MVYNGYYKVMSNIPKMGHLHPNSRNKLGKILETTWVESDWCRAFLFFATLYGFLRPAWSFAQFELQRLRDIVDSPEPHSLRLVSKWLGYLNTSHIITSFNKTIQNTWDHFSNITPDIKKTFKKTPFTLHTLQSLHIRITRDFAANSRETHPPAPTSGASLAHEDRQSRARAQEAVNEVAEWFERVAWETRSSTRCSTRYPKMGK